MADNTGTSRRKFLKRSIGWTGGLAGGLFAARSAFADLCGLTPPQTIGPYYPVTFTTDDSINDLTIIEGHGRPAKGETIFIRGMVTDESCNPINGALVEIWQAAASGRYNHPSDDSGLELDPDFQGWGEFVTDSDGTYAFKTVVPGPYPADTTWTRTPHVHFKVTRRGFRELITQLYFTPTSFTGAKARQIADLNAADRILREVPSSERVIVEFAPSPTLATAGPLLAYREQNEKVSLVRVGDLIVNRGEKLGRFDLTLGRAG